MSKLKVSAQEGRALVLALIVLGVGSLLIAPFLAYISTNLLASRTTEERLKEQYAADSGIEYALWQLQNGVFAGQEDFAINNKDVNVTWGLYITPTYKITSTATSLVDGSSTRIESYIEKIPGGNLDLFEGALVSGGDITLKKDCTVAGDIYYEGDFNPGQGFQHLWGEEIHGGYKWPTQEENEEFAQRYKKEAMACGDSCIWEGDYTIPIGNGIDITDLGPLYITGNLHVAKDNIINFNGTIYVEGSIDMDKESECRGDGNIVAVGDIYLAKMAYYGTEGSSIIMSLNGNITFKKEATVAALIYAPNGNIKFDKEADVIGAVVGANRVELEIESDKNSTFTYCADYYDVLELPGYNPGSLEVRTYNIYPQSQ